LFFFNFIQQNKNFCGFVQKKAFDHQENLSGKAKYNRTLFFEVHKFVLFPKSVRVSILLKQRQFEI